MKKHTVTIKDIARKLGISPSTVSRALKDHKEISQNTKNDVHRVAAELNYQPNSLALNLRYSRSNTIGVIIPEIVHFFFSTVISGIEDVAHARGYNVIITQSNESLEREISNIQTLFNNRVGGVLISISKETLNFDHIESFRSRGLPFVFFDRESSGIDASQVTVDDFQGGYEATQHLIEQGYQRIGHIGGPTHFKLSIDRQKGYEKALKDHGMAVDPEWIINRSASSVKKGYDAAKALLARNVDAIFATNDIAAMGSIRAALDHGLSVPDDFGAVGFSNWQFSILTQPTISSIEHPGMEIGRKATELLIEEIELEEEQTIKHQNIKLPTHLVFRQSSNKTGSEIRSDLNE